MTDAKTKPYAAYMALTSPYTQTPERMMQLRLREAVGDGNVVVVKKLLAEHPELLDAPLPQQHYGPQKETALMVALYQQDIPMTVALLELGANPNSCYSGNVYHGQQDYTRHTKHGLSYRASCHTQSNALATLMMATDMQIDAKDVARADRDGFAPVATRMYAIMRGAARPTEQELQETFGITVDLSKCRAREQARQPDMHITVQENHGRVNEKSLGAPQR